MVIEFGAEHSPVPIQIGVRLPEGGAAGQTGSAVCRHSMHVQTTNEIEKPFGVELTGIRQQAPYRGDSAL